MFMQIAIAAIGIGIVLMVGYLVMAQVSSSLTAANPAGSSGPNDTTLNTSILAARATVFSGFALIAVGIIVLAAFGLISVFK
jgi:hypothetical protein